MTSRLQELEREWEKAIVVLNKRVKDLGAKGLNAFDISEQTFPERQLLKAAYTAVVEATNQVAFNARIVAPTYEDVANMAGWMRPKIIVTHRSGRKVENGLSYALIIRGYLRDHELTAGWDGEDL